MEQQVSHNSFSAYLREKYNKALTRFEKGLESGRFASYSKQKKAQIWNRLNRYAKQLGIALKPGLIAACFTAGLCFSSVASAQTFTGQTGVNNPFDGIDVGKKSAPTFADIDGDGDQDALSGELDGSILYYKNTGTASAAIFVAQTGANNPFDGVDVGDYSKPTFVDIDGDGDQDVFIGELSGLVNYYKNTGTTTTAVFTEQTGANNPFNGLSISSPSVPFFVDIDGDGDKDAFSGDADGFIFYCQNTGTNTTPVFVVQTGANNPFNGIDFGYSVAPSFADIDGDGDQDAFIGEYDGVINYYKNIGTAGTPVFSEQIGTINPFNGVDIGSYSTPAFVDIDADGDLDVFIGEYDGIINYYKDTNTPPKFVVQTGANNPFDGIDVGKKSAPTFADIDGDGDQDALSGELDGSILYYKNTGTASAAIFVAQTGTNNPFDGVDVGDYSKPTFVDIDGDGDEDVFIGEISGLVNYYKNTGTTTAAVFTEQTGANNPFNGLNISSPSVPFFVDIDGDGDKDAFSGDADGFIFYCKNTGTNTTPVFVVQTGANNPFDGIDFGYSVAPSFADLDGDGDQDAFIGEYDGVINYYKNIGTALAPVFIEKTGNSNFFNSVDIGSYSTPAFVDIDADGDLDVFIGEYDGIINYYKDTNTPPKFVVQTGVNNPFDGIDVGKKSAPTFADIDGDGDQDALSGEIDGSILYYKNTGTASAAIFVAQTGANNPFDGVDVGDYSKPTFVDIDGDGDQDVFIGELSGLVNYYKNTGTTTAAVFTEQTGANNPFNGLSISSPSVPFFVDIDGDGDKDAFSGDADGFIFYCKNTGTNTTPVFVVQTGANNPFDGIDFGYSVAPSFADIDGDGDQDAFIGEYDGVINYYKNIGSAGTPVFIEKVGTSNFFNGVDIGAYSTPAFVDIDADGDLDVFIGEYDGIINYYENNPSSCTTPVFTLGASSTRCQVAETISYAAADAVSYSLTGGGSSTINTSTGEVVWDAAFSGSATITAIGSGCDATHVVTVNPATSAPTITAGNTSVCVGANVTLTGVGTGGTATEYAWFKNGAFVKYDTQPTYTFPALAGTNSYTLVVIYAGSCPSSVSSTATVVTGIAPAAVITPSVAPPYCVGAAPTLMANTGTNYTYSWIGTSPTAATTTTSSFVPTTSGNHKVIVTDANGCSKSSTWASIALNALPAIYPGTNQSTCVNNSVSIGATAAAGLSYSWTPSTHLSSATASNPTVLPTATGTINYSLTVTNATGCKNTGTVSVTTAVQPATPSLAGTSSSVCQGGSITLTPSGVTGAVNWYKGGVLNFSAATNAARIFSTVNTSADAYTIRAKIGTCLSDASNTVPVEIKAAPTPTLSATPAIVSNIVSVCNPGQTSGTAQLMVNLPSGAPTATYKWQQLVSGTATNLNPAATNSSYVANIVFNNNKVFRAEVTYSNGCIKNTSNVTVKMLPSTCTARAGQTADLTEAIFTAYPNPTENVLTVSIQNSTASDGKLVLYNALGQVITSRTITLNNGSVEESLDLSGLASGVYTLSFQTKDGNQVQKIVKE